MPLVAFAVPILPGETETVERFAADLDAAGLRGGYEELNRAAGIRRHIEWVQPTAKGDVHIIVFDAEDPAAVRRRFTDGDQYDEWWRERVRHMHGFDPQDATSMPRRVFNWESDESERG
jgi:hypothetical protein